MITYEPPEQQEVDIDDYVEGIGTVMDPDDFEVPSPVSCDRGGPMNERGVRVIYLLFDKEQDADVIERMETRPSTMTNYVRELVRRDMHDEQLRKAATDKLLPCPFCGGKAERAWQPSIFATKSNFFSLVVCTECRASTGPCENDATATRAWDRRAEQ